VEFNADSSGKTPEHAAVIYLWDTRTASFGNTPVPIRQTKTAAHTLVVCFKGTFRFKYPGSDEEIVTRSMLISAGYTPNLDYLVDKEIVVGAVYLNPIGQDFAALSRLMTKINDGLYMTHRDESHIITEMLKLRDTCPPSAEAYARLDQLIIPPDLQGKELQKIDPRIIKVVNLIKRTVSENVSVNDLAESVHLSPSRLCKLFSSELGIPIRRYRLWRRLFVCTIAVAEGKTFLEGGLEAGFSSPAHCSKTYTALVGLNPAAIFTISKYLKIVVPEKTEAIAVAE